MEKERLMAEIEAIEQSESAIAVPVDPGEGTAVIDEIESTGGRDIGEAAQFVARGRTCIQETAVAFEAAEGTPPADHGGEGIPVLEIARNIDG